MITAHGLEIKSIYDFDKAAKQSPEVKTVNAWHKVYATQRKVVMDYHHSKGLRVTINFGFHRRSSVLGVRTEYNGQEVVYDEERIFDRSRLIAVAIDARQQRFPDERRYVYRPLIGEEKQNQWNEVTRERIVKDYNQRDLGI